MITTDRDNLKVPCEEVSSYEEAFSIIDALSKELDASTTPGIGLAANQIGINKQVCILRLPETDSQGFIYLVQIALVNPKITRLRDPVRFSNEGCLSFPNQHCETLRYNICEVSDLLQPNGRTFKGLRAICAQHEIDHLAGRTMYDRLLDSTKPNSECPCGSKVIYKQCCKLKIRRFGSQNAI